LKYPDTVTVTKTRRLEGLGHVVRMDGERTAVYGKANQDLLNWVLKKLKNKSRGRNRISACREGNQGQT